MYVCVREKSYPPKERKKVTEKQKIFLFKSVTACGEENQHLSARERTKKERRTNVRRISRVLSIVSCSFYGKRFRSRRDVYVDILLFFNNKSRGKEKIFLFGVWRSFTLE